MPKRKPRVEFMPKRRPVLAFTVDRKAFAAAVGRVARFVPERPPVPVLQGILIEASPLLVDLTATDYADTARLGVAAEVELAGRVLLPGAILARIVRNLSGDTVRVEVDRAVATLDDGRTTYRLLTLPTEDYPDMSEVDSVAMDGVKPAPADTVERNLNTKRGLATVKMWCGPGRASRLYEPKDLQPGAWLTWTRHTPVEGTTTTTETETIRGQVWSVADGPRSVWAIPEGERRPVRVTQDRRSGRLDEFPEPRASAIRRRALSEGTIVVEAEELRRGDVVIGTTLPGSAFRAEDVGGSTFAGAVVESVGNKRKRYTGYYDRGDTFETPVKVRDGRTMPVPDYSAVRVIRPKQEQSN